MVSPSVLLLVVIGIKQSIQSVVIASSISKENEGLEHSSIRRNLQSTTRSMLQNSHLWIPCVPPESSSDEGIFYVKIPKTSSTTLAKITSRIAGREGRRRGLNYSCKIEQDPMVHHTAFSLKSKYRNKEKSFLWSVIRHPSDRVVSHYGMKMKRGELELSDEAFVKLLNSKAFTQNLQLRYLYADDPKKITEDKYPAIVDSIIEEFNFIGIYERLYESLVVLSMLLGVSLSDVVFDFSPSKNARCGSLSKPDWLTPAMENYLNSPDWTEKEKGDFLLYKKMNESLDHIIDLLGPEIVREKVEQFTKIIQIGTDQSVKHKNMNGCGVMGLHPDIRPYENIADLPWFDKLSPEDQVYIKKYE